MSGSPVKKERLSVVVDASRRIGTEKRFWEKVNKTSGCWLWTGFLNNWGYGVFNMGNRQGNCMAYRMSYFLANGAFDRNLNIMHKCDTPACVRPSHLKIGTQADNVRDMIKKGRHLFTTRWNAKLTIEIVRKLRSEFRFNDPDRSIRALAVKHRIHPMTVYDVITFRTWGHIL